MEWMLLVAIIVFVHREVEQMRWIGCDDVTDKRTTTDVDEVEPRKTSDVKLFRRSLEHTRLETPTTWVPDVMALSWDYGITARGLIVAKKQLRKIKGLIYFKPLVDILEHALVRLDGFYFSYNSFWIRQKCEQHGNRNNYKIWVSKDVNFRY